MTSNLERITLAPVADFVRTYGDYGLQYLSFKGELADFLGDYELLPVLQERISKGTLGNWQKGKNRPHSVRGLEALKGLGITYPINLASERFEPLNILAAYTFFSGELSDQFQIIIHPHQTSSHSKYNLGNMAKFFNLKTKEHGYYSGSDQLGRCLSTLGIHKSEPGELESGRRKRKAEFDLHLPAYVKILAETRSYDPKVYSTLLDWANVFLITRSVYTKGEIIMYLPFQKNPENAENLRKDVLDIFGYLFEGVSFVPRLGQAKNSQHKARLICLRKSEIPKFIKPYSGLVDFPSFLPRGSQLEQLASIYEQRNRTRAELLLSKTIHPSE